MKKLLTLFMATVVVASMYALPQKMTTEKNGRVNNPAEKNLALKAKLEKDAKVSDFAFDRKAVEKKTEKQQTAKQTQKPQATRGQGRRAEDRGRLQK